MEKIINKDNFKSDVLESDIPVLVDFWAPWCMPCRMLAGDLAEFASEHEGELVVGKINVDEEEELAQMFSINSIPCLILFKDGQPVKHTVGLISKEEMEDFLN